MRKSAAILLTVLVLFNAIGFYSLILGLQYNHSLKLQARFDNNRFNEEDAILIKVPLAVPYAVNQTEFARVDGQFEFQGEHYRMVKQKLSDDTLHVICVKDVVDKKLSLALKEYVKTFSGKSSPDQQSSKLSLNFLKDFFNPSSTTTQTIYGWAHHIGRSTLCAELIPSYFAQIILPPES